MGALVLVQLIVVDVFGLLRRHPPGTQVAENPADGHFRAVRALANTNENVGALVLVVPFAWLAGAPAPWLNYCAVIYVLARLVYTAAYYLNLPPLRSASFGIALAALMVLLLRSTLALL